MSLLLVVLTATNLWFMHHGNPGPAGKTPLAAAPEGTALAACLQPPANIDWTHISSRDLARYGLPPRPFSAEALPQWLALLRKFKRRSCSVSLPTSGKRHGTVASMLSTEDCTQGACPSPTWAGAIATGGKRYQQVQATWTLPAIHDSTKDTSSSAWIGLGGVLPGDPLVQAGIDNDVDVQGQVIYEAWAEAYLPATSSVPFQDNQILLNFAEGLHPNDQIYVDVLSDLTGSFDSEYPDSYFIGNVTTGEYANYNPSWPAAKGTSAEWIVEQPTFAQGQQISFKPLTSFGTISFGLSSVDTLHDGWQLAGLLPLQMATIHTQTTQLATAKVKDIATIEVQWLRGS